MIDPAATYEPTRVQKHNGSDKPVPHLWVVYRCPHPQHNGAQKLDAYHGPPYCRQHGCYLEPVNLGVEHVQNNRKAVNADPSRAGTPQR